MRLRKENLLLYAITDRAGADSCTLINRVEEALKGGATIIQLRDKNAEYEELLKEAEAVRKLCTHYNVPFIMNDSAELAIKAGADGVHIGQSDGSVPEIRKLIGKDMILGVSARSIEDALKAEQEGADYIGTGAVFGTDTKADAKSISIQILKSICDAVSIPVVAIGGINETNILQLSGSGISGAAIVSAIFAKGFKKGDTEKAAQRLRLLIEKAVH